MTKAPDPAELTERDQTGLRPKRLKFVETYPEVSRQLHCDAPPIGRYEIFEARDFQDRYYVNVVIRDDFGRTKTVEVASSFVLAVAEAQSHYETKMLEGMEYA